ncbi:lipid kinase [Skermanella aerolata KACC 11604]|uniref:lipid kinase n=1 Tax=Skermanella aerolata TaxID=393310 RepID=UPI0005C966FA|nr:lipid kinase [Skermanella aerolata]KJB89921.1 lipid kinase [Skermanella aerolata KACC 11604]
MTNSRRRALLLVNRNARAAGTVLDDTIALLDEGGIDVREEACPAPDQLAQVIRQQSGALDCVIIGGGDGTLNAAAPALVEAGLPLGILPLGTANDLARTLEIPPDPIGAARIIAAGRIRTLDLGEVNGRLFWNVASIGLSAELAREITSETKQRWGRLGYGIAALRLLARMRPFTAEISHDGVTERVRTVQIAVGNGRHYGGGMVVEGSARPDDGVLHLYSLEVDHWWKLLALYPAFRQGRHGEWRDVRAFACTEVEVRTKRRRTINTDGELTESTPARFRVRPGAIRVYAPHPGSVSDA